MAASRVKVRMVIKKVVLIELEYKLSGVEED